MGDVPEVAVTSDGDPHQDARRRDAEARRAAQSTFDRPFALEAGAGTGKTTVLVARTLAWCVGIGWERSSVHLSQYQPEGASAERIAGHVLEEVVAITFTEAAAAEMESRIGRALAQLAEGRVPHGVDVEPLPPREERSRRARALLGALDHLGVRTIHAFCRRLLTSYPLEAGISPSFAIDADGSALRDIVVELVDVHAEVAYAAPCDPTYLALAAAGIGANDLADALIALVEAGDETSVLAADPFVVERVAAARDRLSSAVAGLLTLEDDRLRGVRGARRTVAVIRTINKLARELPTVDGVEKLCATARSAVEGIGDRVHDWGRGKLSDTESAALEGDGAQFTACAARLDDELRAVAAVDPRLLGHLRTALQPLLAATHEAVRSRGVMTFAALLGETRALLRSQPEVCARVRRGLSQLLVDEFQDTDRVQCDILRALAFEGPEQERPGLFLVGDPKQSIYGWRSADLLAYDEMLEQLRAEGGELQRLSVSFRSPPVLLDEVARIIAPSMRRAHGLQPEFEPLVPAPERMSSTGFVAGGRAAVEHWVSWSWEPEVVYPAAKTAAHQAAEVEAEALARDVSDRHHTNGVRWADMVVLMRSMSELEVYVRALRELGVPYRVSRDRNYYRRREVIEAAALVRAVLDPNDTLALVTLLRSPAVGVPDVALIPLWARELPRRFGALTDADAESCREIAEVGAEVARELPDDVPGLERVAGWENSLSWMARVVGALRSSAHTDPPDVWVERMRRLSQIEAGEASRYLGAYRVANLERFYRDLTGVLDESGGDAARVLRSLRRAIAEEHDAEEARPREVDEDALQLLTIHQAKGLDFDHVYIVQLHKGSARADGRQTRAAVFEGRYEYTLLGQPTLGFGAVRAHDEEVSAAERVRLLYVALTRARERLVVMGNWPRPGDRARPESLLSLLEARTSSPLDLMAMAEQGSDGVGARDAHGVAWVFPGRGGHVRPTPSKSRRGARARPDVAALRASTRETAARRRAATLAMTASWSASVVAPEPEAGAVGGEMSVGASERSPRVAREVGTVVHRLLETIDLDGDVVAELRRRASNLRPILALRCAPDDLDVATAEATQLIERVAAGTLITRLRDLSGHVVARELPVLLPPTDVDEAVGFVAAVIDLVYRDPLTGELVVADYKTDVVGSSEQVEALVRRYGEQGRRYVDAVADALALPSWPRFELWLLTADQIEVIDMPHPGPREQPSQPSLFG